MPIYQFACPNYGKTDKKYQLFNQIFNAIESASYYTFTLKVTQKKLNYI